MKARLLLFSIPMMTILTACQPTATELTEEQKSAAVEQAKVVLASHEELVRSGDLDGIIQNMAEDIVVLAPDAPLVVGREATRQMYVGMLGMGAVDMIHHYDGAEVVGDLVVLHGVARGTLTPEGGVASEFANNFMLTLRKETDGDYRVWRAAFAPGGE
jgi:ketosteroid isomerase-like protein